MLVILPPEKLLLGHGARQKLRTTGESSKYFFFKYPDLRDICCLCLCKEQKTGEGMTTIHGLHQLFFLHRGRGVRMHHSSCRHSHKTARLDDEER